MAPVNKWLRKTYRWLVVPFALGAVVLIVSSFGQGEGFRLPGWLTAVVVGSLLALFLTGLYLWVQYYGARWRRSRRIGRLPGSGAGASD